MLFLAEGANIGPIGGVIIALVWLAACWYCGWSIAQAINSLEDDD